MLSITANLSTGWGLFFIASVIAILMSPYPLSSLIDRLKERDTCLWTGIALVILGGIHIYLHNILGTGLEKLITTFGYITLLKGVMLIAVPDVLNVSQWIIKSYYFSLYVIIILFLGIFLVVAPNNI